MNMKSDNTQKNTANKSIAEMTLNILNMLLLVIGLGGLVIYFFIKKTDLIAICSYLTLFYWSVSQIIYIFVGIVRTIRRK